MRATRNRVYGVTRIGGSNPSSSAIYSTVLMAVFFFRRLSCFKCRLGLLSTDGIMAWASNAVAGAAAFLRRKMFPRACRQNQPEHRLVLLSASPHPPFTAPS